MKKFFNKLSNSGNLRDEVHIEEEQLDTHFRKSTTLPADAKDTSEDIKMKKSFSLSKATSPRYKEAMGSEDFSLKKSSSGGLKKEKIKDKLNESDDKLVRKSKSMKAVSPRKSSDQVKNPNSMRSPSLKTIFASQYEQQRDGKDIMMDSDSESEEDAFVPHQHPNFQDDESFSLSTPIRVPSAPARLASSPSSPPPPVSLHVRTTSPSSPSHSLSPSSASYAYSSGARSPTSPVAFVPPSPSTSSTNPFSTSPTARVPAFTQSPPAHAWAPTPHVVVADEFETKFGQEDAIFGNGTRDRSESMDTFGLGKVHVDSHVDSDSEPVEAMETDEIVHQKKSGLFSFGSNKPTKLKA